MDFSLHERRRLAQIEQELSGDRRLVAMLGILGTKSRKPVLLSRAFADFVERDFTLERVGEYPVRGFSDPIELFAYHG